MIARIIAGKLMAVCGGCGKIIRLDKPVFGSFHFCATAREQADHPREIAEAIALSEKLLLEAT